MNDTSAPEPTESTPSTAAWDQVTPPAAAPARRNRRRAVALGVVALLTAGAAGALLRPIDGGATAGGPRALPASVATTVPVPPITVPATVPASVPTTVVDPAPTTTEAPPTTATSAPQVLVVPPAPTPAPAPPTPLGPPVLQVTPSIVLEDGVYETDLLLRNAGERSLIWTSTPDAGDVLVPASGTIAAGQQVIVHLTVDEYATGTKTWGHDLILHSDGGDALVQVHGTTLLPAEMVLLGGSWVGQTGLRFDFDWGTLNAGFQWKNDGDLPVDVTFSTGADGRVLGDTTQTFEGGEIRYVGISICDVPAPGIGMAHDVPLHIDAGEAGSWDLVLRYHLNAGQMTAAC